MTSHRYAALLGLWPLLTGYALCHAQPPAQENANTGEPRAQDAGQDDKRLSAAADEIITRTNALRGSNEREALEPSETLEQTAQSFADFMARTDRYGHHADGSGPASRAKRHGYEYCVIAENIAFVFSSAGLSRAQVADKSMKGWRQSPEHRENMLDPDVTEIGVAAAQSEASGRIYLVQLFGRPQSQSIGFEIENSSRTRIEYSIGDQGYPLPPGYTRMHKLCHEESLSVHWPGRSKDRTLDPVDGGHYRITRAKSGELRLEAQ